MMSRQHGRIALVGSGEYLPQMARFEKQLLEIGGSQRFIQIPTAAGRESESRLKYWERLGKEQAERIGAVQVFLPIFSREDAMREELADQMDGAGLIYLSGGDPHYLVDTLRGTPIHQALIKNWKAGSSLAGCSAGAMALGPDIPHFRNMKAEGEPGFALVPHIRTIPHYNKFFRWIPEIAAERFLKAPDSVFVVGIDEDTAMHSDDLVNWVVDGNAKIHVMKNSATRTYDHGSSAILPLA